MNELRTVELFAGIGGLALGLERAGYRHVAFAEIDPFGSAMLRRHWPGVPNLGDVSRVDWTPWRGRVDVLAGGFPCQPVSVAGARKAGDDARWLWPECARALDELRPALAIFENVPGLLTAPGLPARDSLVGRREFGRRYAMRPVRGGAFEAVLTDLAALGYVAEWTCLTASAFGAPHRRERVFIVAYADGEGLAVGDGEQRPGRARGTVAHGEGGQCERVVAPHPHVAGLRRLPQPDGEAQPRRQAGERREHADGLRVDLEHRRDDAGPVPGVASHQWMGAPPVPALRRVDDGSARRMDRARLRGLGNAVVPDCAEWVGRCARRLVA